MMLTTIAATQHKLAKGLREAPQEFFHLVRGTYPAFVTDSQSRTLQDEVPVFMFHRVDPDTFSQQLEYLHINGYHTLTLDEFMAFLEGRFKPGSPSVLLTFDDGDRSWYQVAYPLLKKYGFHAIGFVVPSYIHEEPKSSSQRGWLSWPELAEMERSGVFNIQSHTYYHARIFVAPHLIDFYHPGFSHNSLGLDIPWIESNGCYTNRLTWGTPIYRFAMRYEERPRYIESDEIRADCTAWVASHGGAKAFKTPGWRRDLVRIHQGKRQKRMVEEYESRPVQRQKLLDDLLKARSTLEERLDKPIVHLCYPEGAGSELAISLSQEAGYRSNFWICGNRRINRRGDSPFHILRVKDDYIFRLPGNGREPLWKIFSKKLKRRIWTLDLY
jgi:peptidoglycan/xylan/chitin deacetylase (PgdA/CDA1 family)